MKSIIIIIFIFLLSSCSTVDLWGNNTYSEKINNFFATSDGNKLIIIGDKYHYIFTNQYKLNDILNSKHSSMLRAEFADTFSVDIDNNIKGSYKIVCDCENVTKEEVEWLLKHKFKKTLVKSECSKNKAIYSRSNKIIGKRFSGNNQSFEKTRNLNNEHVIYIEEDYNRGDIVLKIAQTPITVAIDGTLALGAAATAITLWPFTTYNIISSLTEENKATNTCTD